MPRHKGKVESGRQVCQEQRPEGTHVREPGRRSNGTLAALGTRRSPTRGSTAPPSAGGKLFAEAERAALLPLPTASDSPTSSEGQRKVNRDGHVEVAKAYYSVPPEYLGRTVWVRWDARLVRIFNHRWEQVALHVRHEPGRFSTLGEHLAAEKISGIERGRRVSAGQGRVDRPADARNGRKRCSTPEASKGRGCCKGC